MGKEKSRALEFAPCFAQQRQAPKKRNHWDGQWDGQRETSWGPSIRFNSLPEFTLWAWTILLVNKQVRAPSFWPIPPQSPTVRTNTACFLLPHQFAGVQFLLKTPANPPHPTPSPPIHPTPSPAVGWALGAQSSRPWWRRCWRPCPPRPPPPPQRCWRSAPRRRTPWPDAPGTLARALRNHGNRWPPKRGFY